jgi:hypothetical protein
MFSQCHPVAGSGLLSRYVCMVIQHRSPVSVWFTSRYLWGFNIVLLSRSGLLLVISMVIQLHSHISVFLAPVIWRESNISHVFGSSWLVLAVIIQHCLYSLQWTLFDFA